MPPRSEASGAAFDLVRSSSGPLFSKYRVPSARIDLGAGDRRVRRVPASRELSFLMASPSSATRCSGRGTAPSADRGATAHIRNSFGSCRARRRRSQGASSRIRVNIIRRETASVQRLASRTPSRKQSGRPVPPLRSRGSRSNIGPVVRRRAGRPRQRPAEAAGRSRSPPPVTRAAKVRRTSQGIASIWLGLPDRHDVFTGGGGTGRPGSTAPPPASSCLSRPAASAPSSASASRATTSSSSAIQLPPLRRRQAVVDHDAAVTAAAPSR